MPAPPAAATPATSPAPWPSSPGLFASLVDGMHRLQQELCAAVAPGVDWRELHLAPTSWWHNCCAMQACCVSTAADAVAAAFRQHSCRMDWGTCWGCRCTMSADFAASAGFAADPAPAGASRVAPDAAAGSRNGGDRGTRRLFHRQPAAEIACQRRCAARDWPLVEPASLRRHPHRGRCAGDGDGPREPDPRRVRGCTRR